MCVILFFSEAYGTQDLTRAEHYPGEVSELYPQVSLFSV